MNLGVALFLSIFLTSIFGLTGFFFAKMRIRKIGDPIVRFVPSGKGPFAVILAISAVVIFFAFSRPFLPLHRGMLLACAAFCVYANVFEFYFCKFDGVYADVLILNGKLYERENFADFPSFQYENADEFIRQRTILFVTKKGHTGQLIFINSEDCGKAADVLKTWI